jgi:hypothetical protein
MKTSSSFASLLLGFLLCVAPAASHATHYAVCVGVNQYKSSYIPSSNWLSGCVPDANHVWTHLTERGEWTSATVTKLTNSSATKTAIRSAITDAANSAVAGDVFVYYHSSHGGNDYGNYDVYLCTYNADYTDAELASDLAKFKSGVKVVVMVDACHSGGLFKTVNGARALSKASPGDFDLAARVSAAIDSIRADETARGIKDAARIASSEIGWVTAAKYSQTSTDFGVYNTDGWQTDISVIEDEFNGYTGVWSDSSVCGSTFSSALLWGWWTGKADTAGVGDGDGRCDAYEGWKCGYDLCTRLNTLVDETGMSFTPQFLNKDVLRSVELGVVGVDGAAAGAPPEGFSPTTYTVVFHPNGGSGGNKTQGFLAGNRAKLIKKPVKRSGYVLSGWAKTPGGAIVYKAGAKVSGIAPAGSTVDLYAKWTKIKKTYKVKFCANGGKGSMAVQKFTYGKAKKLRANKFRRKGYEFVGWAKSKKGAALYKDGKKVKNLNALGKTVKLYAVWRKANEFHWGYITENSSLKFTTGGDAPWRPASASEDDFYSARSGKIGDGQTTWLKTTVKGPGRLIFNWKASCDWSDKLAFYVDGRRKKSIMGTFTDEWVDVDLNLKAGKHVLMWAFEKNGSKKAGSDCGWVDAIYWERK